MPIPNSAPGPVAGWSRWSVVGQRRLTTQGTVVRSELLAAKLARRHQPRPGGTLESHTHTETSRADGRRRDGGDPRLRLQHCGSAVPGPRPRQRHDEPEPPPRRPGRGGHLRRHRGVTVWIAFYIENLIVCVKYTCAHPCSPHSIPS